MKNLALALLPLFLAGCAPSNQASPDPMSHGGSMQTGSADLSVKDHSTDAAIAFSVKENDAVFARYGISHTKELHLIVVRDDLRYFQHLHPVRDDEGVWHVPFTPPAGGQYWRYADFVDADGQSYTIRFDRQYPGDPGPIGIVRDDERLKTVQGNRIVLSSQIAKGALSFSYQITDPEGRPAELEEYLGAMGHSVLISPAGDFIHTHPAEQVANKVVFSTPVPPQDFYRVFTQFKIAGQVITVDFDWPAAAEAGE